MKTKTEKAKAVTKSYYDTKDKDAYIEDKKSLSKIRSKNLRQFCEFYNFLEVAPVIWGLNLNANESIDEIISKVLSVRGAGSFFTDLKTKELLNMGLDPELIKNVKLFSRRTIYDYMNAVKFIKACFNRGHRLMAEMAGVK